ncbi:hypothetical protein K3495_g5432 [Podosphaera aphanis]|nr:hypothetical protein K3495_g5432 [Podosphaera aphanis]
MSSNWFNAPRQFQSPNDTEISTTDIYADALNSTAVALTGAALEEAKHRLAIKSTWTGIGVEWLRSLLGKREWRLPCVDVYIRL